jgi:TRAP-type C4-dicarboxylate transport system permease small subunit
MQKQEGDGMDRAILVKIATDTAMFACAGLAVAIGMMTSHKSAAQTFTFDWSGTKLTYALMGAASAAFVVAIIRWRMWVRSHPDALR